MGKYGKVADFAMKELSADPTLSPVDAWKKAVTSVFPESESSQEKGCPRGAFLGLCEAGLVKGVPAGDYTRSDANKTYALRAASILKVKPELVNNEDALWAEVMAGNEKTPNHQMDVVVSLWRSGAIKVERL